jgi:hypothetical protein
MNTNRTLTQAIVVPSLATGLLLLIPLVAMQFTDEVVWTLFDFIVAGTLLFGTGLTYKLLTRKTGEIAYRVAVGFALFTGLFLIWANLAVGIIGSENNPINIMYFGVIIVGIIGAFIVRFKSTGMTYTMFAMAIAMALVAVIALISGMHRVPYSSVIEIVGVNGFFFMLFVVSALLFRYASHVKVSG